MWRNLSCHSETPCDAVDTIEASAIRTGSDRLSVRFLLTGELAWLDLPAQLHSGDQRRVDELWKTTCFEAFVRPRRAGSYHEFNLAPTGNWAAYSFDSYRAGMRDAAVINRTFRSDARRPNWYDIAGTFRLAEPAGPERDWLIGLSAVIEARDGTKSYWALVHAPGPPDFHHRACFAATLPAPRLP